MHLVPTSQKVEAGTGNFSLLPSFQSSNISLQFIFSSHRSGFISPCMCLSSCLNLYLPALPTFRSNCLQVCSTSTTRLCASVGDFNRHGPPSHRQHHNPGRFVCLQVSSKSSRSVRRGNIASLCALRSVASREDDKRQKRAACRAIT